MSCQVPYEIKKKYPHTISAIFITSTEYVTTEKGGHSDGFIADTNLGYVTELEKCGQAANSIGSEARVASPYPTGLRAVTDLNRIYKAGACFLDTLEFYGYDPTLVGSASQEATVLAEIIASKSTNDTYMLSFYRNGMLPNFQPNFCRPSFLIDGKDAMPGLQASNYGDKKNAGDLSIGIPLSKCWDIQREFKKIDRIDVFGQIAQQVDLAGVAWYQRMVLQCVATFWLGDGNDE